MNWNQLIEWIKTLTPEQRETDVTVHDIQNNETYKVEHFFINTRDNIADDVLDENHPLIAF